MNFIVITIVGYLMFNIAIWVSIGKGGMLAMAAANLIGAVVTAIFFRKEVMESSPAKKLVSLMGSFGILLIVLGLLGSHQHLPVSLSIEAVYNGFAIASWPLFVLLGVFWSTKFTEKPNRFDLFCHLGMAVMVTGRFMTYPGTFEVTMIGIFWIAVAIAGYALFNISIKLSGGHRRTNILMNIGGGLLLAGFSPLFQKGGLETVESLGVALGGLAIFTLVFALGKSYQVFGSRNQASLVAPLVYDGLLIVAPLLSFITGDPVSLTNGVLLGLGMLLITYIRWSHHTKKVLSLA